MRALLWPDEDADELEAELEEFLADPTQVAFVAERDGGGLCGFTEASVRKFANSNDESPCAFLEGWWVDEDVRRTGVGRALVAAVEDWARAAGFTELGSDAPARKHLEPRRPPRPGLRGTRAGGVLPQVALTPARGGRAQSVQYLCSL